MTNHKELAKSYFLQGYNCSQSILLAFHEELGLDEGTAARMASPFGGGMGRLREVCGTVSGMFLVLGLLRGYDDPKDQEAKTSLYQQVQRLAHTFQERNGSIICRELLGLDHQTDSPTPSPRTPEYYKKRPCADLAADAAQILEEFLQQS